MSYQVIARKWRPQTFDEVVYQDHISTTIRNSIKGGRISHAYLFAGPRGVGKTTMARIVAKSLNCATGPTESPCGTCENCLEIRDGRSFDVIEIDGASNRGIENIRELRENVNFTPVKSRYKVYIIDEVHMLTKEAFNALLKTLEEPPPHVVFIFATTEIHQVPETILSRCQKFFFKKMSVDALASHLKRIAGAEGFGIDDTALYAVSRAAEGSMRDAQSLLDQVISFSDGHINEESALAILGVVSLESHLNLLRYIAESRAVEAIAETDRVISMGADIPRYAAGILDAIRALRLMKSGVDMKTILGLSPEELSSLNSIRDLFNDEELSVFFRIITDLQRDLRFASNERIHVEMAVMDILAVKTRPSIASILEKDRKHFRLLISRVIPVEKKKPLTLREPESTPKNLPLPHRPAGIDRTWVELMKSFKGKEALPLHEARRGEAFLRDNVLTLLYPDDVDSSSFSRMLDTEELSAIKEEMTRLTGIEVAVAAPPRRRRISGAAEKTPGTELPGDAVMIEDDMEQTLLEKNPMVEKLIELFHGRIIDTKGDE